MFLPIPSHSSHGERWFYVADQARLVGYDNRTKRAVGSIGPDGFVPAGKESKERFKGPLHYRRGYFVAGLSSPDFLPYSDRVYTVDFEQRAIQPLFTPGRGQTVLGSARKEDKKHKSSLAFVLTENAVHAVNEAGVPVFSAPLAYDLKNYRLEAGRLDNSQQFAVWYQPVQPWAAEPMGAGHIALLFLDNVAFKHIPLDWSQPEPRPSYLVQYDAGGNAVKRRAVPPLPVAEPSPAQALYGLATPLAGVILYNGASQYYFAPEGRLNLDMKGGLLPAFTALMLLSAAGCALVCFLLARRYAFSRARCIGWTLCGLLWGGAGLLLMLALEDWPARIACQHCHKPRVVSRERCEHCGAPHSRPAADGTEIFEQTAATPHAAQCRQGGARNGTTEVRAKR
jgi:hypothetical protein